MKTHHYKEDSIRYYMRGKPIKNYKTPIELGKEVWKIKTKDGKLIDSFRSKALAIKRKKELEKLYFEELKLIRI